MLKKSEKRYNLLYRWYETLKFKNECIYPDFQLYRYNEHYFMDTVFDTMWVWKTGGMAFLLLYEEIFLYDGDDRKYSRQCQNILDYERSESDISDYSFVMNRIEIQARLYTLFLQSSDSDCGYIVHRNMTVFETNQTRYLRKLVRSFTGGKVMLDCVNLIVEFLAFDTDEIESIIEVSLTGSSF